MIRRRPILDDALHDRDTHGGQVVQAGQEAAGGRIKEELVGGETGRGSVEIGGGAHHDNAGEIDDASFGATKERGQDGIVFLGGGAVVAGAVGEDADVFFEAG